VSSAVESLRTGASSTGARGTSSAGRRACRGTRRAGRGRGLRPCRRYRQGVEVWISTPDVVRKRSSRSGDRETALARVVARHRSRPGSEADPLPGSPQISCPSRPLAASSRLPRLWLRQRAPGSWHGLGLARQYARQFLVAVTLGCRQVAQGRPLEALPSLPRLCAKTAALEVGRFSLVQTGRAWAPFE